MTNILQKLKEGEALKQKINCGAMLISSLSNRGIKPIDIILCQDKVLNDLCLDLELSVLKSVNVKKYDKMVAEIKEFGTNQKYRKRLSIDQVRALRKMRKGGGTVESVATAFSVTTSTVSSVTLWISYADVDPELKDEYMKAYNVERFKAYGGDIIKAIRSMVDKGYKRKEIARKLGIDPLQITQAMANYGIRRN